MDAKKTQHVRNDSSTREGDSRARSCNWTYTGTISGDARAPGPKCSYIRFSVANPMKLNHIIYYPLEAKQTGRYLEAKSRAALFTMFTLSDNEKYSAPN